MNYLAAYLGNHPVKTIAFASASESFEDDVFTLDRDTSITNILSLDKVKQADMLVLHNYFPSEGLLYDYLKTVKIDTAFLYYDVDKLDYFEAWESLRDKCNNVVIVLQKEERKTDVLNWKKDKNNNLEISIILPVYNVEKYIKQCIDTITEWKAPYIEFLFISDGSKDGSVDIIKEAASKDKRIKLIEKENGGCATARQLGLERALGRYIGFTDPDDFIDPTMFKKLLKRALLGDMDIAMCGFSEYYDDTGKHQNIEDSIHYPFTEGRYCREDIDPLIAYMQIGIWRGIYRREMIEKNGIHFYTDMPRFDDLPFKTECMAVCDRFATVDEYLYFYRLGVKGQTVSVNDERLFVQFVSFGHLDDFFRNRSENQKYYYSILKRGTHRWTMERMDKKYIKEYKRRMKEAE